MTETSGSSRYVGKPLLRLLESYVLWAIGELPTKDQDTLEKIRPKLQDLYQRTGTWQDIVASVMALPHDMPELIRESWAENTLLAARTGTALDPGRFAQMFVDEKFLVP